MIPKFRIFDKKKKRFLDDFTMEIDRYGIHVLDELNYVVDEDDRVLMQSTGMFDKNKNEIYEGDVVNITGIYDHKIMCEVVEYCKRGAYYDVGSFMLGNFETHHIEIIGNIHEHPELLD
ncbi:YopX family protein [Macrococcoides caseolyticum]|uniref:YopX family protein n=1 Tax=Macrococcoides caseolyticum TaxID=69966 RepID=UPI0030EC96FB